MHVSVLVCFVLMKWIMPQKYSFATEVQYDLSEKITAMLELVFIYIFIYLGVHDVKTHTGMHAVEID